jgi:predicted nucleic acid-binding protein
VLTLDTSGILAAQNERDPHHSEALVALQADSGPFIVPAGIMAEATYMIEARLGPNVLDTFLGDLEEGAFALDSGEGDLPRVRALITRYRDLPLDYADASVIACAERNGGRVLTYDLRHFAVVGRERTVQLIGFEETST